MEHCFGQLIKCLLVDGDMYKILKSPLTDKMSREVQLKCRNSVEFFFEEFNKMESDTKIQDFVAVSKDISEWIPRLLGDTEEAKAYQLRFNVIFDLLHLKMDDAVKSFPMNEVFLSQCCISGLLTERRRDELIAKLRSKGPTEAKYQFLWELPFRNDNAYGLLLEQLYKSKTCYIEKFCGDLHKIISRHELKEVDRIACIRAYAESVVRSNMNIGSSEREDTVDPVKVPCDDCTCAAGGCVIETDYIAMKRETLEPMDLKGVGIKCEVETPKKEIERVNENNTSLEAVIAEMRNKINGDDARIAKVESDMRVLRAQVESDIRVLTAEVVRIRSSNLGTRNKVKEDLDVSLCKICLDKPIDCVLGCGHMCCRTCADKLDACHMCRRPIRERLKIFI